MQLNVLGAARRRRWSYDEKVRHLEETLQPGETVCGVAHSLLFTWHRQARQGRLGGDAAPALVPLQITPVAAPISSGAPQLASSPPAQHARAEIIDIELGGGCRVRVDRDVDVKALQQVLERQSLIATGHTDMRRGMRSLALTVQEIRRTVRSHRWMEVDFRVNGSSTATQMSQYFP